MKREIRAASERSSGGSVPAQHRQPARDFPRRVARRSERHDRRAERDEAGNDGTDNRASGDQRQDAPWLR
jgi:hypothetical protein